MKTKRLEPGYHKIESAYPRENNVLKIEIQGFNINCQTPHLMKTIKTYLFFISYKYRYKMGATYSGQLDVVCGISLGVREMPPIFSTIHKRLCDEFGETSVSGGLHKVRVRNVPPSAFTKKLKKAQLRTKAP